MLLCILEKILPKISEPLIKLRISDGGLPSSTSHATNIVFSSYYINNKLMMVSIF